MGVGVLLAVLALGGLLARGGGVAGTGPGPLAPLGGSSGAKGGPAVDAGLVDAGNGILVGSSYKNDVSLPLRDMKPLQPSTTDRREERENPPIALVGFKDEADSVVQRSFGDSLLAMPATGANFAGIGFPGFNCNCAPPDTNGEAGATQYVQTVNTGFQVWSKTGTSLYGPAAINSIWQGFGGACQANNDGDPVVLYDQIAGRWLISQFTASSPYNECVAISTTSDATGSWYRYAFQLSTTDFPDYPHLSVWPDGYYMSVNWFNNGSTYGGPRPYVFNRANMLTGAAATFQTTSGPLGSSAAPIHPADLDGNTLPPTGAAGLFAQFGNPLKLYKFQVNWTTPSASTWTNSASLSVAGFTQLCGTTRSCVPQPGTSSKLDGLGDRLMHRVAYRNFGTYESMIVSHSVNAGSNKRNTQAAPRWYEIRNPSGTATVYQQGTYAPDSTWRWMGSAAQDKAGNLAIGYSASSNSVYPAVRYAGRLATDPLGQLSQGEAVLKAGVGSQSQTGSRWGDYSALSVDPADDCTFWYTNEYYPAGATQFNWRTQIGSFKFAQCTP